MGRWDGSSFILFKSMLSCLLGETLIVQIQKDLAVDRGSFDRIIAAGGFICVPAGSASGGNSVAIRKQDADLVMDAAAWIGWGACVTACPNAAAALFVGAKLSHLGHLPHG